MRPTHGRSTLDLTFASDYCFEDNTSPFHFIVQLRADLVAWDTGFYRGQGLALGKHGGDVAVGEIES